MKKIILSAAILAATLSACSTEPTTSIAIPASEVPAPGSCKATNNVTPCTLTNQEAFIAILEMSQSNVECSRYREPKTWQDMLLPPVPTDDPDCLPGNFRGDAQKAHQ